MQTAAVFFGGRSNEREISVITGIYAVNLLRGAFEVLPVYLDEQNEMFLVRSAREVADFVDPPKGRKDQKGFLPVRLTRGGLCEKKRQKKQYPIDCALNCCHGGLGEGGGLSALLQWHEIVSASPAAAESALFLDKTLSKIFLRGMEIPVVDDLIVRENEWRQDPAAQIGRICSHLGFPVIVKPSKLGSSIGISVAENEDALRSALSLCFSLDGAALVEKYLPSKRDLNCAAFRRGGEVVLSEVEEVFSAAPILSFEEKYESTGGRTSRQPAEIPEETAERIKEILRQILDAFDMNGIVRADFLLCGDELYFNELNTVPGTLATYLFGGESLLAAKNLLESLLRDAIERALPKKQLVSSGILSTQSVGGKRRKLPR